MKLGILQIDLDLAIFQKTAVGILNYRSSLLCSGFSGFSLLHSHDIISIHLFHSHDIISIIQHYSKDLLHSHDIISRKCRV